MRSVKRRGFSLLEICIVVVIVTMVIALALGSTRRQAEQSQSQAVAQEIALQLLNKKQEAAQSGVAAGLAFPGSGAIVSQGYYEVRGLGTLRIHKAREWRGEYPGAFVAWGAHGIETTPAGTHPLAAMPALPSEDPAILFLPSGEVVARGIATDDQYHFLRVGGSPVGADSVLSGLNDAWTISVSKDGIVNASATPDFPSGSAGSSPTLADLPKVTASDGSVPRLESLSTIPELVENSDGTLRISGPQNQIQVTASAESPEGDPLFIRWTCDGGQFSHTGEWLPMTYSAHDDLWKASTLWSLPPVPAATHLVQVQIRDPFGNSTSLSSQSSLEMTLEPDPLGVFVMEHRHLPPPGFGMERQPQAFRSDGTRARWIAEVSGGLGSGMSVSPSGQTVLQFSVFPGFSMGALNNLLDFRSVDGAPLHRTSLQGYYDILGWKADSTGVVLARRDSSEFEVQELSWGTGNLRSLYTVPAGSASLMTATEDFDKILFTTWPSVVGNKQVQIYDRAAGAITPLFTRVSSMTGPSDQGRETISPSGRWVVSSHTGGELRLHDLVAGTVAVLPIVTTEYGKLEFSPDERMLRCDSVNGAGKDLCLLELDGTEAYRFEGYGTAAFSPSWDNVVVSSGWGDVTTVDLASFQKRLSQKGDEGIFRTVEAVTDHLE
jgi:type II secretory pathway pseudopilin PulG